LHVQVIVRVAVFVVHDPSRAVVLVFVEQYGVLAPVEQVLLMH
jgi:hypothetical protein